MLILSTARHHHQDVLRYICSTSVRLQVTVTASRSCEYTVRTGINRDDRFDHAGRSVSRHAAKIVDLEAPPLALPSHHHLASTGLYAMVVGLIDPIESSNHDSCCFEAIISF
jgi:hypothetical protein